MTRRERAQACLARLWCNSGLKLTPYNRPIVAVPVVAQDRIDALLNMPSVAQPVDDDEGSSSGSGRSSISSCSSSSSAGGDGSGKGRGICGRGRGRGGRGGGRGRGGAGKAAAKAPRPMPIGVSGVLKSVLQTETLPVIKDLHRLGRADLRKRRPPGHVETAKLRIKEGECGVGKKELYLIQSSQLFADGHNRPAILTHAANEWRANPTATLS